MLKFIIALFYAVLNAPRKFYERVDIVFTISYKVFIENSELILNFFEKQNTSCYMISQSIGISESTFSKLNVKPTSKVNLSIV